MTAMQSRPQAKRQHTALYALLAGLAAAPGLASAADAEVEALKSTVDKLQQQLNAIEQAQASAKPADKAASGGLLPAGLKIYGSLDSGVERVSEVGATDATVTRVPSTTGAGPSTLGLDYRGKVNDYFTAIGKAEMGLYLDSGSSGQGGRLFGRQLYVGLDTSVGSFTVGRQYTMLFYGLQGADILGPNIYGLGSIDAYIPNARADNSVVWRGKWDKLSLGAQYSFGRETISGTVPASGSCAGEDASGTSRCRGWSVMAKYDDPRFGLSAAVDNLRGGTGAQSSFFNGAAAIALTADSDSDRRSTINGYVRFGALKVGAGWLNRKVETSAATVKQDTTWLQGEYAITPQWIVDGGIFHVDNDLADLGADLYALRGTYKVDDQLSTYLTLGYMDNSDTAAYGVSGGGGGTGAAAGNAQLGTMVGVRYRF